MLAVLMTVIEVVVATTRELVIKIPMMKSMLMIMMTSAMLMITMMKIITVVVAKIMALVMMVWCWSKSQRG